MSAPMDNTIDGITKSIFERNHGNMVLIDDLFFILMSLAALAAAKLGDRL